MRNGQRHYHEDRGLADDEINLSHNNDAAGCNFIIDPMGSLRMAIESITMHSDGTVPDVTVIKSTTKAIKGTRTVIGNVLPRRRKGPQR